MDYGHIPSYHCISRFIVDTLIYFILGNQGYIPIKDETSVPSFRVITNCARNDETETLHILGTTRLG